MTGADYALTAVLQGLAVAVLVIAARTPRLPPEQEPCSPMVPLDPFACEVTAHEAVDPLLVDVATQNLYVLVRNQRRPVHGEVTWLCWTAGCRQVHRTRQGAEFCSMMQLYAESYTRPLD